MKHILAGAFFLIIIGCHQNSQSAVSANSLEVHYYTNGKVQDSIRQLFEETSKQFFYYETGELKEAGFLYNGTKCGAWRTFNKQGLITNIQYFDSGRLTNKYLDTNDYYFAETPVDSSLSVLLPSKWQINVREGFELVRSKFWQPDSGYSAQIAVRKGNSADIPGNTPNEISKSILTELDNAYKNNHKVFNVFWPRSNILFMFYIVESYGKMIGIYQVYYFSNNIYYSIAGTAFNGESGQFNKYLDVFQEMMYSIKWNGKNAF